MNGHSNFITHAHTHTCWTILVILVISYGHILVHGFLALFWSDWTYFLVHSPILGHPQNHTSLISLCMVLCASLSGVPTLTLGYALPYIKAPPCTHSHKLRHTLVNRLLSWVFPSLFSLLCFVFSSSSHLNMVSEPYEGELWASTSTSTSTAPTPIEGVFYPFLQTLLLQPLHQQISAFFLLLLHFHALHDAQRLKTDSTSRGWCGLDSRCFLHRRCTPFLTLLLQLLHQQISMFFVFLLRFHALHDAQRLKTGSTSRGGCGLATRCFLHWWWCYYRRYILWCFTDHQFFLCFCTKT